MAAESFCDSVSDCVGGTKGKARRCLQGCLLNVPPIVPTLEPNARKGWLSCEST